MKAKTSNVMDYHNKPVRKTGQGQNSKGSARIGVNNAGAEFIDRLISWLMIIAITLIPLALGGHVTQFIAPEISPGALSTGIQGDLFVYYKWVALIILAGAVLLLTVIKLTVMKQDIRSSYINLPVLAFTALVVMSAIFAEYKGLSLYGMYDMREGLITMICYFVLFFAAANTRFKNNFVYLVITALSLVVLINVGLRTAAFYDVDLLKNSTIYALVVPEGLEAVQGSSLSLTLMNGNYLSGLGGAMFAFCFSLALLAKENRKRLFLGIATVLSFVMMITSLSTSGVAVAALLVPVILMYSWISQADDRKNIVITAGLILLVCCGVYAVFNQQNTYLEDEFGNIVKTSSAQSELRKNWPGKDFGLPRPGWSAGTGRTYIWQNTLPLIMQNPLIGYGPGTFAYYFPQNDIAKEANMWNYNTWVTKPHNMYLGIAYSAGIPALIILLFLFARHFFSSIGILFRKAYDENYTFIAALFAFWLAFLMQWLFNDSFIGTSVIFWVLFGISVSLGGGINYAETEKLKSKP